MKNIEIDETTKEYSSDPILSDSLSGLNYIGSSLKRRRFLASSVFVGTIAIAVLYTLALPPKYTAKAIILVDPRQQRVIETEDVLAGIGSDPAAVESQVELLRAAAVSSDILSKYAVFTDPEFNKISLLKKLSSNLNLNAEAVQLPIINNNTPARNKAINEFERHLSVQRRGLTYILDVAFTSIDPRKAADIANSVADEYLSGESNRKQDAAKQASAWLNSRLASLGEKVRLSEQSVATFKAKYNIVDLGTTNSGETLRKSQIDLLNNQLSTARTATAEAKARYEQAVQASINFIDTGNLQQVLNSQVIGDLRLVYSNLKRTEVRDAGTFGQKHPSLLNTKRELASVTQMIENEINRILASVENNYKITQNTQVFLEKELKQQLSQSENINQLSVELRELERNATADRNLHDQFLSRLKETTEQTSLKKPDAQVISRARVPNSPSSISKTLMLAGAAMLGALLAVAIALITGQHPRTGAIRKADASV